MNKDYQKGRADASKGTYDPPEIGWFDSRKQNQETLRRKEEYREGYYDKRREMGKNDSSGCFITTACVESLGLPDNCRELTVLRAFRDGFMLSFPRGRMAVMLYYRLAPEIVAAVRKSTQTELEFHRIFHELVCPAVELVQSGRNQEAFVRYQRYVEMLAVKYHIKGHAKSEEQISTVVSGRPEASAHPNRVF